MFSFLWRLYEITGDAAFDAPAQGLSDRLGEALVLMGLPRVLAPASVAQAQSTAQAPADIGKQLGASEIIETTLTLEAGERLRISARLIRAADGELAWAEVRTTARATPYPGNDALFDAVLARFTSAPVTPKRRRSKDGGFASAPGEGCAFIGKTTDPSMIVAATDNPRVSLRKGSRGRGWQREEVSLMRD